jgi:ABC transport system ATP-binding/permease protein
MTTGDGSLEAHGLSVALGGYLLIPPLSVTLAPGELVGLIGPSGSGKTTLLRGLCGGLPAYAGEVTLAGSAVAQNTTRIGYVPAEDLVHPELTVAEELEFAAALRAAPGTTQAELKQRTTEALADLRMAELADAPVSTLSQGQRRRVSCGIELVGRPSVMLLDEPAGGLDPELERRLMGLLRGLADAGRGVIVATHATQSLRLCDRVLVLAEGGELRFDGPPAEIEATFGVERIDLVYTKLDAPPGQELPEVPRHGSRRRRQAGPNGFAEQLRTLIPRSAICRVRDTRSLAILIGQAPLLAIAIGAVLPARAATDMALGPYYSVLLAFMLLTASIWLGTISACRELVSDRAIIAREAALGVSPTAQLVARAVTVLPLVILQTALLAMVTLTLQPVYEGALAMVGVAIAAGCASACMGLWLSAASRTSDQATIAVPILLIPQLLFAGALIPIERMPEALQLLSNVCIGRWALAGMGGALDLDERLGTTLTNVSGLDGSFFAPSAAKPIAAMAVIGLVCLVGARWSLRRGLDQ